MKSLKSFFNDSEKLNQNSLYNVYGGDPGSSSWVEVIDDCTHTCTDSYNDANNNGRRDANEPACYECTVECTPCESEPV